MIWRLSVPLFMLGILLCISLPASAEDSSLEKAAAQTQSETGTEAEPAVCSTADCEPSAPYSLKIINRGEASPRSPNASQESMQDNRRVDVTVARQVPVDALANRSADLAAGGTLWLSKDPSALDRALQVGAPEIVEIKDGQLINPVMFEAYSNYAAFFDKWELRLYKIGSSSSDKPLAVLPLPEPSRRTTIDWNGELNFDGDISHGHEIEYSLRAYDGNGQFDQTRQKNLRFVRGTEKPERKVLPKVVPDAVISDQLNLETLVNDPRSEYEALAVQGITVSGAKVRVHGLDIAGVNGITINGDVVKLSNTGGFAVEYLLPRGKHTFNISAADDSGADFDESLQVDLTEDYFFMVALADLTIGENSVSGSIEPLAVDQHHYGGDIFVDGRLAFYLKGKIRGKYLLTAQLDTGTEDVSEIFDDFHRKDPASVFRRLDPDQYYLVYGDDSNVYNDTDSQGKLYIKAEWDKSHVLWGNFNTAFSGAELAPFNRSLYGVQAVHKSVTNTDLGDTRSEFSAFASEAQTAFRHNEFLGTGGSLYYLRDKDIVRGSEKVWVEIRQNGSTRVLQKIALVADRDYEIDDFQGRLILKRPLTGISGQTGPSIIRDEPLPGNDTFLIVDYEYIPSEFDRGNLSAGVRAKHWFSDNLALGGTWAHENRDTDDYDIRGTDLTLKKSDNSYFKLEYAESESSQTAGSFISTDGGLNFTPFNANSGVSSGQAYGVEARILLADFGSRSGPRAAENSSSNVIGDLNYSAAGDDIIFGAWAKRREAGFSTANVDSDVDTTDAGVEAFVQLGPRWSATARATRLEKEQQSRDSAIAAQIDYAATDKLDLAAELRFTKQQDFINQTRGSATIGAGRAGYDVTQKLNFYGVAQDTLSRRGSYERNRRFALGSEYKPTDRLSLNGEISTGDRGQGVLAGAEWSVSDSYNVYSNISTARDDNNTINNSLTFGQRKNLSKRLKIYSEHQFTRADQRAGISHTVGLDHAITRYTSASISLQVAEIDDDNGGTTDRDAVSLGLEHKREKLQAGSKFEYRRDRSGILHTEQWVVANRLEYRQSASLRWQGKFNASITEDLLSDEQDASFVEAGLGFAFRPVKHDRLNLLGRLTWLRDLPPLSQSSDTDEASLIASLEGIYDLTRYWGVGAKLAHRESRIRQFRDDGPWVTNDASLLALRLQYRVPFGLDVMGSYHWLNSADSESLRQGFLFAIGHRVGDHLKFSVGYNFTDFDDDLTDNSYDSRGWFINLVGTY